MTTNTIHTVSGVNIDNLKETIDQIQKDPQLGRSRFHIHNKWIKGAHNRGSVVDFYSGSEKIEHKKIYTYDADEPDVLGGQDQAANPVEHLLNALAACLTNSLICHGAVRGIEIQQLECDVQGEIDLNGFLGLSGGIRKGFQNITVNFKIKTDEADTEKLRQLALFSPVLDTISQGTPVNVSIEKK